MRTCFVSASVSRIFCSDVCTKYQEAAKIVNLALQGLVSQCVPGASVLDLCEFGHTVINTQAQKLFTKKVDGRSIDRGVAFPVCISVNDVVCNFSPLPTDETVSTHFWVVRFPPSSCLGHFQVRNECMPPLTGACFLLRNRCTVTLVQTHCETTGIETHK